MHVTQTRFKSYKKWIRAVDNTIKQQCENNSSLFTSLVGSGNSHLIWTHQRTTIILTPLLITRIPSWVWEKKEDITWCEVEFPPGHYPGMSSHHQIVPDSSVNFTCDRAVRNLENSNSFNQSAFFPVERKRDVFWVRKATKRSQSSQNITYLGAKQRAKRTMRETCPENFLFLPESSQI